MAKHTQKTKCVRNILGLSEEAAQKQTQPQGFDPSPTLHPTTI